MMHSNDAFSPPDHGSLRNSKRLNFGPLLNATPGWERLLIASGERSRVRSFRHSPNDLELFSSKQGVAVRDSHPVCADQEPTAPSNCEHGAQPVI